MGSSAVPSNCVGPGEHLRRKAQDAEQIIWWGATLDAARAKAWTCLECHPSEEYELCTLGGLWFIRRSRGRTVYETARDTERVTMRLWADLLEGSAR